MISLRITAAIAAPALILLASNLSTRGGGVQSGSNSVPQNCSKQMPSCQQCHSGSGPSVSRNNGPTTSLVAADLVLQPGQQISVTTSTTGGLSGSNGGFICETTAGSFTAGSNSRVMSNSASVTHVDKYSRSWNYTFTAPNTPGLVEMTSAGMTSNGSGSSGDEFSFSGYDENATTATPLRLFVLPTGVVDVGASCPDGYGNLSVLGAGSAPTLGNSNFGFELHGASPAGFAFLIAGFNPPNFTPLDLGAMFGLTGCNGYVASSFLTLLSPTGGGLAIRADGSASFALPLSTSPLLLGVTLDVQSAFVDPTATSMLGRSLPFTFSNGLRVTFQ